MQKTSQRVEDQKVDSHRNKCRPLDNCTPGSQLCTGHDSIKWEEWDHGQGIHKASEQVALDRSDEL